MTNGLLPAVRPHYVLANPTLYNNINYNAEVSMKTNINKNYVVRMVIVTCNCYITGCIQLYSRL